MECIQHWCSRRASRRRKSNELNGKNRQGGREGETLKKTKQKHLTKEHPATGAKEDTYPYFSFVLVASNSRLLCLNQSMSKNLSWVFLFSLRTALSDASKNNKVKRSTRASRKRKKKKKKGNNNDACAFASNKGEGRARTTHTHLNQFGVSLAFEGRTSLTIRVNLCLGIGFTRSASILFGGSGYRLHKGKNRKGDRAGNHDGRGTMSVFFMNVVIFFYFHSFRT